MPAPILLALEIAVAVAVVGVIVVAIRSRMTFRGYEDLTRDAREIERAINGELFRDGSDLVVSGNHRELPVVVRFSYDENTPGLNIQMKAPAVFTMSVVPKGERASEGRVLVRTGDDMFDARFTTRSDQPTQAKMFLGKPTVQQLQRLCCSSKTFFTVSAGALELSELTIPREAGHHITEHIKQLGALSQALKGMPGAEAIKIQTIKREGRGLARLVLAVGVVAVVITIVGAVRNSGTKPVLPAGPKIPEGVYPVDADKIPRLAGLKLAQAADMPDAGASWQSGKGEAFQGRIAGDFSGKNNGLDAAYVLSGAQGKRVVILADGQNVFDRTYSQLAVVALVPKEDFSGVKWSAPRNPPPPEGDALLIINNMNDPSSAVVVYRLGNEIATAIPSDYNSLNLE